MKITIINHLRKYKKVDFGVGIYFNKKDQTPIIIYLFLWTITLWRNKNG